MAGRRAERRAPVRANERDVSVDDVCDRPARVLADGETIAIGAKRMQWIDTPHVPHGWDAGLCSSKRRAPCSAAICHAARSRSRAVTDADIVGPSEQLRAMFDYYSSPARPRRRSSGSRPRAQAAGGDARRAYRGDCVAALRSARVVLARGGTGEVESS